MKICILTHCFYPSVQRGGPTVSMTNMAKAIANCGEVSVITVGFDKDLRPYSEVNLGFNRIMGCDVYYLLDNTPKAFYGVLNKIHPDVIYISSFFSWQYSVAALFFGKRTKTRIILAPRGEFMPSALVIKQRQKSIFLTIIKILGLTRKIEFHATSKEEEKSIFSYFQGAKVWRIKNLPTVINKQYDLLPKIRGELKIIMIGRIHPIKNVDKALRLLEGLQGKIKLNIYGTEEVSNYVTECKRIAKSLPGNIQVEFCGVIRHEQIQDVIANHHILLSPTQSENFGQAIVETLLVGRPAVISDNTPWLCLEKYRAGFDISLDNMSQFQSAIQRFTDMEDSEYEKWCKGASEYINEHLKIEDDIKEYKAMFQH